MSIYKGNKIVAGGSIDTHFVRRPVWDQAVFVSAASMLTGYKAPADGMIVGLLFTNGNTSTGVSVKVNGVEIARNKAKDSDRILNVQCLVSKDNVITITGDDTTTTSSNIRFVPFEDSTVSESDVEVVTPELIRNLHDPDWSKIQHYTSAQLAENITMPARGIFICTAYPISVSPASIVYLKINNKIVDWSFRDDANGDIRKFSFSGPVCKGDVVTVTQHIDSSNTIAFVPYKAQ